MARASAEDPEAATIAILRGSESQIIGGVAVVSEGSAAISLSQGGFKKRYSHTDPNEDAAAFALGEAGVLLAVADGHNGCDAAESAIDELMCRAGALLTRDGSTADAWWKKTALETIGSIQTALVSRAAQGVRGHSRTTLALALVLPGDDLLAFASVGDSHIFRVCPNEVVDLGSHSEGLRCFLGNPANDLGDLAKNSVVGIESLANTRAVILATDGISEPGIGVDVPEFAVSECAAGVDRFAPELRPLELARNVSEAALAAHQRHRAGDNIAAAVTCLPPRQDSASETGKPAS
ncbi:MAG: protein phosphatase 2C domain-containing protein [Myxococcales bacterium]|nr:protein phosphatase 2C domain-containing protein [Myxococcales bacterium]